MDADTLLISPDDEVEARRYLQAAVGDTFEVRERIGRGGFADVFLAYDPLLKRSVAIKVLRRDLHPTPELLERFRREAESIAALRHPNLLPIHAIGEKDGTLYIVLEYVRGETLEQFIMRERPVSVEEVIRVLDGVARALSAVHDAGILHRDLKPANIMLEGSERHPLLMDFGLAGALEADSPLTRPGMIIGTPQYLSPEQAAGDSADHRADLYTLGIVGYELVTGNVPFDAPTLPGVLMKHLTHPPAPVRQARPECPLNLSHAIEKCLAKSPDDRWQSAAEFREVLHHEARAADESVSTPLNEPLTVARSFQLLTAGTLIASIVAIVLESTLRSTVSWSLLFSFAALSMWALRYGELSRRGYSAGALLTRAPLQNQDAAEEEFGRHSHVVQTARHHRTRIVRALSSMTRVEQQQLKRCGPAADALLARCLQNARKMRSLDQQITAERLGRERMQLHSRKLITELTATREHTANALHENVEMIAALREIVERSQSATEDVSAELARLLAAGERAAAPGV